MTYCSWVQDDSQCGSAAEVKNNIPLCPLHRNTMIVQNQMKTAAHTVKVLDASPDDSVYFLKLPNGNIKIGYSARLPDRLRALSRDFGGYVQLLACTNGGIATEQRIHNLFREYRITDMQGEQFEPRPELLEYIRLVGIDEVGAAAAQDYKTYTHTGNARIKAEYRLAA